MTERERLLELLDKAFISVDDNYGMPNSNQVADYLLDNGVLVPPCKIGDSVFWISAAGYIWEAKVKRGRGLFYAMTYADNGDEQIGSWYDPEDIGVSVYLTREEAEKALKEREK